MSELSKMLQCCDVVGVGCHFAGRERTQAKLPTLDLDYGSPFPLIHAPRHALKAAFVIRKLPAILRALFDCASPEILSAIVKRVVVFVVAIFFVRPAPKNHAVHQDSCFSAPSIEGLIHRRPKGVPVELRESFKVFRINYCVLALGQWDKAKGFINRLGDCVSFYAASGHLFRAGILARIGG
jgi:hypothetical protein